MKDSELHEDRCPICNEDWQQMLNDLERLAHLIIHVALDR